MSKTLRELRLEKGITQIELSKMLDISYQNLRNYESGFYMTMREDLREKIEEIFGEEYQYRR